MHGRRLRVPSPCVQAVIAVIWAACAGDSAGELGRVGPGSAGAGVGPGISIEQARASDLTGPLLVNGWLWREGDNNVRLCARLTDSVPPKCGEPFLIVEGLDVQAVDGLRQEQDVTWSQEEVQVLGEVERGVLTIAPLSKS